MSDTRIKSKREPLGSVEEGCSQQRDSWLDLGLC